MSLLLASNRRNSENPPRDDICSNCNKSLKEPSPHTDHNIMAHQENPASSKRSWSGPSRSSDSANLARPIPKPIKPKLSPKPSPVFPERFGSGNWSINTGNNHYHSSGSGDRAKTTMPWSYQNVPLNPSYPSGSGPFFLYDLDPSLTLGLGDRSRFSGNFVHGIGYPNSGTYALAIPETPVGLSQRPMFKGLSKVSAFRPYKSLQRENGESEDQRDLALKGKKRVSPEASEMPMVMKPPKRREVNLKIDPESHLKKEVREQLLFTDFSCLEITNEDRTHLDLSLHL